MLWKNLLHAEVKHPRRAQVQTLKLNPLNSHRSWLTLGSGGGGGGGGSVFLWLCSRPAPSPPRPPITAPASLWFHTLHPRTSSCSPRFCLPRCSHGPGLAVSHPVVTPSEVEHTRMTPQPPAARPSLPSLTCRLRLRWSFTFSSLPLFRCNVVVR